MAESQTCDSPQSYAVTFNLTHPALLVVEADAAVDHSVGDVFQASVGRRRACAEQLQRVDGGTADLGRDDAGRLVDAIAVVAVLAWVRHPRPRIRRCGFAARNPHAKRRLVTRAGGTRRLF